MDLQTLLDRAAIDDVLDEYAAAIDARDFARVSALFTADAHLDYRSSGGPAGPRDEVVDWLRSSLPLVAFTQHLLTNRRVRIDGDTASVRVELFNPLLFDSEGETSVMLLGGRYDDRLTRTDDGWRIVERIHTTTWTSGLLPGNLATNED